MPTELAGVFPWSSKGLGFSSALYSLGLGFRIRVKGFYCAPKPPSNYRQAAR